MSEQTKRDAYRERREAQLREWAAKLDGWQASTQRRKAEARIRYEETLDELRSRLAGARARLEELVEAGAGARDDLETGIDQAFDDLRRAFKRAASKFD